MPIYEYRCKECGRAFEKLRRMSEADAPAPCPACESEQVERQVSAFAARGGCAAPAGSRFT